MYLFLFLLMPLFFALYCIWKKDKQIVPAAVIGGFSAVLVCAFKLFFMFAHRVVPYSFPQNFVYFMVRQSFLPVLILFGVFFAVSRDTVEYKVKSYLPLVLCFYMIYTPYSVVSAAGSIIPFYMLFIKPMIYLSMCMTTGVFVRLVYENFQKKNIPLMVLFVFAVLVYLVVPSVLESMFAIGFNTTVLCLLSALYCGGPVVFGIIKLMFLLKNKQ